MKNTKSLKLKFPDNIYVTRHDVTKDDSGYLVASEDLLDFENDEVVAIYERKSTHRLVIERKLV